MQDWIDVGRVADVPVQGSRTLMLDGTPIAVFRTLDDRVFALVDRCPHKQGPLSQGIVFGHSVSCPLHNWRIALDTGAARGDDEGCTPTIAVDVRDGRIRLARPAPLADAA